MNGTVTISQQLAQFAADASIESLPPMLVHSVTQRFLDTIGVCIAASSQDLGSGAATVLESWGGRPESSLVGKLERYPAAHAAFHNGTLAHSLDFDDTHLPSVLHPSATIVPATLAVAEACHASGAGLLVAATVGIEITIRLGLGGYLLDEGNVFFERGWHATSICGTLGAAASAAKLLGLGADGIAHAIGIAASMGSGLLEANRRGGTVKRLHCGWAAHSGISAAQLAAAGFTAPMTALEGRFGFYRAFLEDHYDRTAITEALAERWEALGVYFKPYPANHYTHAGIDAALAIRAKRRVRSDEIAGIELGSSQPALRTIGEPREEKIRPQSGYHAKFSAPFTIATALLGGGGLGVHFEDFTDSKARDPELLGLASKVTTFVDPACDRAFPNAFAAVLRVHFTDGSTIEERVMDNRGGPGRPLTDDELRRKFTLNVGTSLSRRDGDRLAVNIAGLELAPNTRAVSSILRKVGVGGGRSDVPLVV